VALCITKAETWPMLDPGAISLENHQTPSKRSEVTSQQCKLSEESQAGCQLNNTENI
jgi:hypothetical protein